MNHIEIINYWYLERIQKHWFSSTPKLDKEILEKFEKIWEKAAIGELDKWQNSPESCLALIIILDQFPLNMFRGKAKSFQTERKAIKIAHKAINNAFDRKLDYDKLAFLFMPFMHSENIKEQELSVKLCKKYNLTKNIKFAKQHQDIIKTFTRFPHRNKILGRESTKEEEEYLLSEKAFKE